MPSRPETYETDARAASSCSAGGAATETAALSVAARVSSKPVKARSSAAASVAVQGKPSMTYPGGRGYVASSSATEAAYAASMDSISA